MIPPLTLVSSPAELTEMWRELMGPGGFAHTTLWVVFFDDAGCVQPLIMPIDDVPSEPDARMIESFTELLCETLDEPDLDSTAFLLSRPGPAAMSPSDRGWARTLRALPDARLRRWPVHLATRDQVRVFAPDDLIGTT